MPANLFSRWIKKTLGLEKKRAKRQAFRQRLKPQLETLEDRFAPAALTTLASFDSLSKGMFPQAGLVEDSKGNLFGTTEQGGAYNAAPYPWPLASTAPTRRAAPPPAPAAAERSRREGRPAESAPAGRATPPGRPSIQRNNPAGRPALPRRGRERRTSLRQNRHGDSRTAWRRHCRSASRRPRSGNAG
jgi:hypothetical protein